MQKQHEELVQDFIKMSDVDQKMVRALIKMRDPVRAAKRPLLRLITGGSTAAGDSLFSSVG
jgi:hypothetical protein